MDTVLGGGPSSTPGRWVFNAVNALNAGVYWLSGLGLSNDENDLYLTLMSINTVGVVRNVNSPGISQFVYICGISVFNTRSNIPQGAGIYSCGSALNDNSESIQANPNPCAMTQPSDVIAISPTLLYVSYYQGMTQIDLSHSPARCLQIAGVPNVRSGMNPGLRDATIITADMVATVAQSGQDPTTYMQSEATLVHFPYRLGFSALKGSLYVADYSNKAVRRFFVLPVCACANNYVPVPDANSCYNPSPRWNARQLPHCAPGTRPICFACLSAVASRVALTRLPAAGFFALEGESTCAHPCSDAAAMGVSVICLSAAPPPPLTFDQVFTAYPKVYQRVP